MMVTAPQPSCLVTPTGLLPVETFINKQVPKNILQNGTLMEKMQAIPTIAWLLMDSGESAMTSLEVVALAGSVLAFACTCVEQLRVKWVFFILWAQYFSLQQLGQTFLWFQWDSLLLELGVLGLFLAPWSLRDSDHDPQLGLSLWRWLAFRLLFSSGIVKLTSLCPTWWDLTALQWHFESQCIPTVLAWYAHQLPAWFLQASVAATYPFLIVGGLFALLPFRPLRWLSFLLTLALQVFIFLTGNYNFFNLATILLGMSVLQKLDFGTAASATRSAWLGRADGTLSFVIATATLFVWIILFDVSIQLSPTLLISARIRFSQEDFLAAVDRAVLPTMVLGAASCALAALAALLVALRTRRLGRVLRCIAAIVVAGGIFANTLEPYSWLSAAAQARMPSELVQVHQQAGWLQAAHSYGLFRRMTGVGGRPEVVVEVTRDGQQWTEIDFRYKPTNVTRMPALISPHQPRLDWQMWFAALGSFQHNPWLVHLAIQLMKASPSVLQLFPAAVRRDISAEPPLAVRMVLYKYHYTSTGAAAWWRREPEDTYMSALWLQDPWCEHFLQHYGFGLALPPPSPIAHGLARLRAAIVAVGDSLYPIEGADMLLPLCCWTVVLAKLVPLLLAKGNRQK